MKSLVQFINESLINESLISESLINENFKNATKFAKQAYGLGRKDDLVYVVYGQDKDAWQKIQKVIDKWSKNGELSKHSDLDKDNNWTYSDYKKYYTYEGKGIGTPMNIWNGEGEFLSALSNGTDIIFDYCHVEYDKIPLEKTDQQHGIFLLSKDLYNKYVG